MKKARDRIALVGPFFEPTSDVYDDPLRATARLGRAIACSGRYKEIDLYLDRANTRSVIDAARAFAPPQIPVRVRPSWALATEEDPYHVVLVSEVRSASNVAGAVRPPVATPVVYDVGVAQAPLPLEMLRASARTRALRAGDGVVVRSHAQAAFLRQL